MNVREGMRRVARVSAIGYAIVALLGVAEAANVAFDSSRSSVHTYTIAITGTDRRVQVAGRSTAEINATMNRYCPAGQCGSFPPLVKASIWPDLAAASAAAAAAAFWWGLVYAVLWALFRSLRWIVRGFIGDGQSQASKPPTL